VAVIDDRFELLWITAPLNDNVLYIRVLYHPPVTSKLQYTAAELIQHLQLTIDSTTDSDDLAIIVLSGDFNQLCDASMQAIGLISVIDEPTHQGHKLDKYTLLNHCILIIKSFNQRFTLPIRLSLLEAITPILLTAINVELLSLIANLLLS